MTMTFLPKESFTGSNKTEGLFCLRWQGWGLAWGEASRTKDIKLHSAPKEVETYATLCLFPMQKEPNILSPGHSSPTWFSSAACCRALFLGARLPDPVW